MIKLGTMFVPTLTAAEMSGGDIAMDALGNLWAVFKSGTSNAIRVVQFPSTNGQVGLSGNILINQTLAAAPTGIAFDNFGDIYIGSSAGLYKADTDAGTLVAAGASTAANHASVDLMSCYMPMPEGNISKSVSPTTALKAGDVVTYTIVVNSVGGLRNTIQISIL